MARSTIITGNGIGMALDHNAFSLSKALEEVWNNAEYLTRKHKDLIISTIDGTSTTQPPESESQLGKLQMAIVATDFLSKFESEEAKWITKNANQIPSIYKKFIHEVAINFHNTGLRLPHYFVKPLVTYIQETKSHIFTLNYDNLLYDSLIESKVLDGYNGILIDGFWRSTGFKKSNLDRFNRSKKGWYIHLHGSPLFINNNKIMGGERDFLEAEHKCHIVLTHVDYKPSIINSSKILKEYWSRLDRAIKESDKIYLFGYSGEDIHLNERIKLQSKGKKLIVIEWKNSYTRKERKQIWKEKTGFDELELVLLDNILDFKDWE
ncbi:SIR2 family protein [Marinomonas primoryensis]|uniref:SIR2 family protein n=1 Tax=Marinomonas primoryensis TaxID=178399 RepID=A0ABV0L7F5_9GAMM